MTKKGVDQDRCFCQQALPALSAAIAGVDALGDSTSVAEIDAEEAACFFEARSEL